MPLLDIPEDVLPIILAYLPPEDYLRFVRVSKQVYLKFRHDSIYWRNETSTTFRLPISPLLAADGPRWYWLYKRLMTQTRLFTWGQGVKGNLGPGRVDFGTRHLPNRITPRVLPRVPARPHPNPHYTQNRVYARASSNWPTEVDVPDEVGVISDLQCGGWSTTILSSAGKLYTVGSIDSRDMRIVGESASRFTHLQYLTESTSAIRQFSSGRAHVLALTDHGQIISWDRVNAKGLMVSSRSGTPFVGKPNRVAAGWGESSAYVPEVGIIYWTPIVNDQSDDMQDGATVQEKIVPETAHRTTDAGHIEVLKHIVLEDFIVYITNESKVYGCCMRTDHPDQQEPSQPPFELPGFGAPNRELKDIQGQFRKFGVFTAAGEVLSGDVDYVRRCAEVARNNPEALSSGDWSALTTLLASKPEDIPALQNTGVIALAYGDYHYHALHANGRMTSYGTDSQCCGMLGLSGPIHGGRFRGLRPDRAGPRSDAHLLPIANIRGREVWFESEKKRWLQWLEAQLTESYLTTDGRPAKDIWETDAIKQAAFSEWVEQQGRHWEEGPTKDPTMHPMPETAKSESTGDYANLGSYFTIAVAAAGWHSGALVLVDEDQVREVRNKWVVPKQQESGPSMPGAFGSTEHATTDVWEMDGFPKVRLPDGFEMPGVAEPRPWRDGMPTMQELGLE